MTTIDIIILVILGAGAIVGFAKGFLRQLAGLLGLVAGLLIAKALYATVAERIFLPLTDSLTVAQGIAFVIIWLAVPLAFLLLAPTGTSTSLPSRSFNIPCWTDSSVLMLLFLCLLSCWDFSLEPSLSGRWDGTL